MVGILVKYTIHEAAGTVVARAAHMGSSMASKHDFHMAFLAGLAQHVADVRVLQTNSWPDQVEDAKITPSLEMVTESDRLRLSEAAS